MMVLHFDQRKATLARIFGRQVFRMSIDSDCGRRVSEQGGEVSNAVLVVVERPRVLQITDMRRHDSSTVPQQTEGCLQLATRSQQRGCCRELRGQLDR